MDLSHPLSCPFRILHKLNQPQHLEFIWVDRLAPPTTSMVNQMQRRLVDTINRPNLPLSSIVRGIMVYRTLEVFIIILAIRGPLNLNPISLSVGMKYDIS